MDSTQPLPDKDFKALIQEGRIRRVGVDCFDAGSVECQAAYHWQAADFSSWMDEIERFVERGGREVLRRKRVQRRVRGDSAVSAGVRREALR